MSTQERVLARDAALIATFYGERGKLQPLVKQLCKGLGFKQPDLTAHEWQNEEQQIFLHRFDPPATDDCTVVQLAMNVPGRPVIKGWQAMRERLQDSLDLDDQNLKPFVWGYTLIYQAVVERAEGRGVPLDNLVACGRRLEPNSSATVSPLAQANVPGGRLWLTALPLQNDGAEAATVYVALGPAGEEGQKQDELVEKVLYGPNATLLMPDLIAHKGYYEMRRYRQDDLRERYERLVNELHRTTRQMLDALRNNQDASSDLIDLADKYANLLTIVPIFETSYISLRRQLHNYQWWRERAGGGEVIEFHHQHLETGVQESELLVTKGQNTLTAIKTAMDMVQAQIDMTQAQIDKARSEQQQSLQNWLAVIGVALAVPQLVTSKVVGAFFTLAGISSPCGSCGTLLLFGVQTLITLVVAVIVWLLVQYRGRRRQI